MAERQKRNALKKMKDEFFSLAAHELRTPITVIKAQAQLAERFHSQGRLKGELIDKTLRTFIQESDRLAKLCSDLLEVARLDGECFEVYLSEFDLADVLAETVARLSARLSDHEISLDVRARDRPRRSRARSQRDSERARQCDPLQPAGRDRAQDQGRRKYVSVTVRDSGIGIPTEKVRHIFRRYYQAHQRGDSGVRRGWAWVSTSAARRSGA